MKISELKKIAKENDYELKEEKEAEQITLVRKVGVSGIFFNLITVDLKIKNLMFIENRYCDEKDFNMIKAAVEFAETPIEDREEEKKFYLKHKYFKDDMGYKQCFCIRTSGGYPLLKSIAIPIADKIKFTKKEIEEIKERFDTDLKDFEEVEVEDED